MTLICLHWILYHLGLNYWKEHRCWATKVISNEVPNCVKEKCDFSTPRTAHPYSKGTVQPPEMSFRPTTSCTRRQHFQTLLPAGEASELSSPTSTLQPPAFSEYLSKVCPWSRTERGREHFSSHNDQTEVWNSNILQKRHSLQQPASAWSTAVSAINWTFKNLITFVQSGFCHIHSLTQPTLEGLTDRVLSYAQL